MVKEKHNDNYLDVTDQWLENAKPNSHEIIIDDYFIDDFGIKHPIKGREKVHISSINSDEYKMALIIKKTLGGEIHMVPTITDISNSHFGVKTPDYIWNNEKWDLKTPQYKDNYENIMNDIFKKPYLKLQSTKFIVDLINFPVISDNEIMSICKRMFNNKYRKWIKALIIVKNKKIYKIFIKKDSSSSDNFCCSARNQ